MTGKFLARDIRWFGRAADIRHQARVADSEKKNTIRAPAIT
jgi:hypothetical protein